MRVTNNDLLRKVRLIERTLNLPKGMEYKIYQAYGKVKLQDPRGKDVTGLASKSELYYILDSYVKGMEDYKDRVKLKQRFKRK